MNMQYSFTLDRPPSAIRG